MDESTRLLQLTETIRVSEENNGNIKTIRQEG